MIIYLSPLAQIELNEAFIWYEEQLKGLGYDFLDEFDQSVRLIITFPHSFQQIEGDLRRCLINRFPYGIIYGIDNDRIIIIAVAHLKREPTYWVNRKL